MAGSASLFSMGNPVFATYVFYAGLSIIKMFLVAGLVVYRRLSRNVFSNEEDLGFNPKEGKVSSNDPLVERAKRNHQNDLENIIPFVLLGFLYVSTNPGLTVATWHFRIFFIFRVLYMLCYQLATPPPSRSLCHVVGLVTCFSMAVQSVMATL